MLGKLSTALVLAQMQYELQNAWEEAHPTTEEVKAQEAKYADMAFCDKDSNSGNHNYLNIGKRRGKGKR